MEKVKHLIGAKRSEAITVALDPAKRIYEVGLYNVLQGRKLRFIEAFDKGRNPQNTHDIKLPYAFLTLFNMQGEAIHRDLPLSYFLWSNAQIYIDFANDNIDWRKSIVTIPDHTGLSASDCLFFNVVYE